MRLKIIPFLILLIACSFYSVLVQAQNNDWEGYPIISNFDSEEYEGHVQNWGFTEDKNGILYVANRMSVLVYFGTHWETIAIPNTFVAEVEFINDRVYVGGAGEFGYLAQATDEDISGLQYYSISDKLPDSLSFSYVWSIKGTDEHIYFRNDQYLFRYNAETENLDFWEAALRFYELFESKGEIYVKKSADDLFLIKGNELVATGSKSFLENFGLRSWVEVEGKDLFCSSTECVEKLGSEFLPFENEVNGLLSEYVIDEVIALRNGTILFATRQNGIIHLSADGQVLQTINKETGLPSNTVFGLYEDNKGSVWVATDNGISKIDFSLPIRLFDDRNNLSSYNYELLEYNGYLYSASGNGVMKFNEKTEQFEEIFTQSGCRELKELYGQLYASCGSILYRITDQRSERVSDDTFSVNEIISLTEDNLVYIANPLNHVIGHLNGEFEIVYKIEEINGAPNSLYQDSFGNIWIGTTANGLYRVNLIKEDKTIVAHTVQNYLSDIENSEDNKSIFVTELDGDAAFLTWGKGILRYQESLGELVQETKYGDQFSDTSIQYFKATQDKSGNVWFRSNSAYQVAWKNEDGSYTYDDRLLSRLPAGQIHTIFADQYKYIWYSIGTGLVRVNSSKTFDLSTTYPTRINQVLVRGDSLINGGSNSDLDVLSYDDNELRFIYSAASYDEPEKNQFRIKLEGFEDEWSSWTYETQKDYTNIPEGEYVFKVEARNTYGILSEAAPFSFRVLPPWYRTWWAYGLYTFAVFGVFYTGFKIRINQLLKVERMRTKIASDLHDEVSATLTGISFFAEAVGRDQNEKRKEHFIELIKESAGDAKEKITDIVWSINPENDNWSMFLAKCRRYASDLLESSGLNYTLNIAENIPGPITMEVRQHLWMVYKEMLTNVVRHSGANRLDVILDYKDQTLLLVIQDNGKGLDKETVADGGNGLQNIRKRAEALNADLKLDSEPGIGTRWSMKLHI